jgi:amidase
MPTSDTHSAGPAASDPDGPRALARRLVAGEVTAAALVERALVAVDATQPTLNAFAVVRREAARREAAAADRRLASGERAPLLGVPVAIKDDTDIAGEPTAFGCRGDFPPKTEDAEVVRRLREAGAVIVGKTNTPELGQWPFTESEAFGVTRNPWSLAHSPGGSSGGSAAAVSAGIVAAAIGSDGAGSVRIPAAWTNLVGIKPQRGRISTWPDPEAFNGLTCHGVLARTTADAAYLLDIVSGAHPGDVHRPPAPAAPFADAAAQTPGRLRIALSTAIPYSLVKTRLDPEIAAAVRRLGDVLADLGHDVFEADPHYGLMGMSFMPRSHRGLSEWETRLPDPALLDPRTKANCDHGRLGGAPVLRLARASERWFARRAGAIWSRADIVLAPTTALPPLRTGACDGLSNWRTDQVVAGACPYTWPWNVLGWPGINVPAGLTSAGLPIGAQLLGPANCEALLLSIAGQLEAEERWAERRPPHAVGGAAAGAGAAAGGGPSAGGATGISA